MTKTIISKLQAQEQGLKRYFTGKPCKHGHISERYIYGYCVECDNVRIKKEREIRNHRQRKYREKDKDRYKAYRIKHRESGLIATKRWRANNLLAVREKKRIWRANNPSAVKEQKRRDYEKNKDKRISSVNKWASKNKDKCIGYRRNTKARRRKASGKHTQDDVLLILKLQNNKCVYCRRKISFDPNAEELKVHVDHIMPIALGGSNNKSNLQCLCPSCNISKNATDPIIWARRMGNLL